MVQQAAVKVPELGRILVVDDEPEALFALVAQLKQRYGVVAVRNVQAALALCHQRFDVILAELHPERTDVRALEQTVGVLRIAAPVIFMSKDPASAQVAREAQAFGFLRKPVETQELEWVLRGALATAAQRPPSALRAPRRQQTRRYDLEGLTGRPRPAP
jgi:DNA-binding NtrC family response regulator